MNIIRQKINDSVWEQIKEVLSKNCQHCSYDSSSGVITIIPYMSVEHIDLKIIIEDEVSKDCHLEDSLFEI